MSDDKRYNGWTNYETWNWKLWMDNDEYGYDHQNELAAQAWEDSKDTPKHLTRKEYAEQLLADMMKSESEEMMPDLGSSVFSDLLGAAMSEINWYEIAENILSDMDLEEEEEEV